jgi:hypothetical protein
MEKKKLEPVARQRLRFAEEIAVVGGIKSHLLLPAFSVVPREQFMPRLER